MSLASALVPHSIRLRAALGSLLLGAPPLSHATAPVPAHHALPSVKHAKLYVDYSPHPNPANLQSHNVIILDPASSVNPAERPAQGQIYLAYIPAVEVIPNTPPAKAATSRSLPTIGKNNSWGSLLLDITAPQWQSYLLDDLIAPALARGYDGVFLDTLDSVEKFSSLAPSKAKLAKQAVSALIQKLHQTHPEATVILNRGWEWALERPSAIDGVLIENLFQGWDPTTKEYHAQSAQDIQWLIPRIKRLQAKHLTVFILDYVSPQEKDLADKTAKRISDLGCVPFISTPDLQGVTLAPAALIDK